MKRFNYLLEQTEIFSHFVQDGQLNKHTKGSGPISPLKMKTQVKKPTSSNATTVADHRHRMTEEEEDAELLSDAKESERLSSITRFEQSPWCKFP